MQRVPHHLSSLCLSVILALCVAPSAQAADWELVLSDAGRRIEIDRASIFDSDRGTKVSWGRVVLSEAEAGKTGYRTIKALNRYDCRNHSFFTIKRVFLDAAERVVREESVADQTPIAVMRNSVDDRMWREVCKPPGLADLAKIADTAGESAAAAAARAAERPALSAPKATAITPTAPKSPVATPPSPEHIKPDAKPSPAEALIKEREQTRPIQLVPTPAAAPMPMPLPSIRPQLAGLVSKSPEASVDQGHTPPPAPQPAAEKPAAADMPTDTPHAASGDATSPSAPPTIIKDAPVPTILATADAPIPAPVTPKAQTETHTVKPITPRPAKRKPAPKRPAAKRLTDDWSYAGKTGPEHWGRLRPEWKVCANGKRQSPINLQDAIAVDLEPVKFSYRETGFSVTDTGNVLRVDVDPGMSIEVRGKLYLLEYITLHRPSQERVGGGASDMVVHLHHRSADGEIANVGVLMDRGDQDNPLLQSVLNNLPLEKGERYAPDLRIDLAAFMPKDPGHYLYMGSLTTPPCTEDVLWVVMKQAGELSQAQLDIFNRLYPRNSRPIQPVNGRLVLESR